MAGTSTDHDHREGIDAARLQSRGLLKRPQPLVSPCRSRFHHAVKFRIFADAVFGPGQRAGRNRIARGERDRRRGSSPLPTARGLPLAGNVFALLRDMRGFVTERYLELGPVFRIRVMHRPFTVLAGPEANRFVQRDGARHLRSYEYWSRFNSRFGAARSVLSTEGAEHKVFRTAWWSNTIRANGATLATVLREVEVALHPSGYRMKTTEVPLPMPHDPQKRQRRLTLHIRQPVSIGRRSAAIARARARPGSWSGADERRA